VRAALVREVSFPGVNDPKATLRDVLDSMAKQWGVRIDVSGEDADHLSNREIADPRGIPPVRTQADWALWSVLEKYSQQGAEAPGTGSELEYLVSDDRILVGQRAWFTERGLTPERPSLNTPRIVARARALREKLARVVAFPGVEDPKTTLVEALDQIRRRWGVKWFLDEAAFRAEMVPDVGSTEVAQPNPIPEMRADLYVVVAKILARIPAFSGATFAVVGDYLCIGTNDGFQRWGIDPEPLPKPTPKEKRQAEDNRAALARTVSFSGFEDPKTTLVEALFQLSKRYDVSFDVEEKLFKFNVVPDVLKTEIASEPFPPMKAPLAKVLQVILDRVPAGEGSKATFAVRRDCILITVGPADISGD
jgi:hypothetical protein